MLQKKEKRVSPRIRAKSRMTPSGTKAAPAGWPGQLTRRKRRSAQDLTGRIVQAAAAEFARVGYSGATTARIAAKAGVTEAQLFRYFGSKSNLFRESIFKPLDEHLRKFTDTHIPVEGNADSFRDMASLYIGELRRFIHENAETITSLVVAQTYEADAGHGVGAIASLGRYFERGAALMRRRGKTIKVRPELMVRVSFAAVLACVIFRDWIFPEGLASEAEIRDAIKDFVLDGISANS